MKLYLRLINDHAMLNLLYSSQLGWQHSTRITCYPCRLKIERLLKHLLLQLWRGQNFLFLLFSPSPPPPVMMHSVSTLPIAFSALGARSKVSHISSQRGLDLSLASKQARIIRFPCRMSNCLFTRSMHCSRTYIGPSEPSFCFTIH
jgi:hypothetical protein